jgi:hypothetical protein
MKNVANSVRIGMVRRRSISPELSEDQSTLSVLQQTNPNFVKKQVCHYHYVR